MHFGHCEAFALIEADENTKTLGPPATVIPPPHEPGVLPRWLHEQGADVILAGGMGQRAQALFAQHGIRVVVGTPAGNPVALARAFLDGTLETGGNACEH
jgi:ATP-binding protein involved in chromosome partitioning